ncbi:MAG: hypothetical protein ABIR58_04490, partial [Gemmatimonadaceae bacterium]
MTIAAILMGLAYNVISLLIAGFALSDLLELDRLVVVSNQLYLSRYAETGPPPTPSYARALLPFVFLAPTVGGILFELRSEKRWKGIALLSFVPAIAVTALETTKAAVLFAIILWFSAYFAARLRLGKLAVFTRRHVAAAAVAGAIVVVFFFAVGLARLASTDVSLAAVVLGKLIGSAFGHMTV